VSVKNRLFFNTAAVVFTAAFLGVNAWAESAQLCANPRPGAIPLAFSIPNFSPGEFDLVCADRIQRAIARGFTAVTITPKIGYDHKQNESLVGVTLVEGELTRCLETSWKAGLDIIYSPHIEDETPGEDPIWRAKFDLKPDQNYELAGFDEFLKWTATHVSEIAQGPQHVRISLETELEASTLKHVSDWRKFTDMIRGKLSDIGLGGKVPLGIQPNWYPVGDPNLWDCIGFNKWISSLDFISPSMYGDWSQTILGEEQVGDRVSQVTLGLSRKGHLWCEVPEYKKKPFGFGELGIGSDLVHTERTDPVPADQLASFTTARRQVYANLFQWMKTQSDFSPGYPVINIWAYGLYDPTGLDQNPTVLPDAEIVQGVQDYKNWRCGPIKDSSLSPPSANPS
jgi:hypothetical protein